MSSDIGDSWLARNLTRVLVALFLTAIVISALALVSFYLKFGQGDLSDKQSDWALFGDFLGGLLNPALAFVALLALLLTLRVQATELAVSNRELKRSRQALAEQSRSADQQAFENTFFQMVRLHNDLLAGIDLHDDQGRRIAVGRDCFRAFSRKLKEFLQPAVRGDYLTYDEGFSERYGKFLEKNEHNIRHYIRSLFQIYKFIEEGSTSNKAKYADIVTAQLSSYELHIIFYDAHSLPARTVPYIEKYAVFQNLESRGLANWAEEKQWYGSEAFGGSVA